MVMQLKLNPRQKCYTKLLSNIVSTGVAQTTSTAEMVNKNSFTYTTLVYMQDIHKIAQQQLKYWYCSSYMHGRIAAQNWFEKTSV